VKRLVCVSNRVSLPRRNAAAGGLAVGVLAALRRTGGLWFGWSGEVREKLSSEAEITVRGNIRFATMDLTPQEFELYYNGYCNSSLWPLLHYFPDRFRHANAQYDAYQEVNSRFARQLRQLLAEGDAIWIHDYHLIPLARQLRELSFKGPIGFFLHTPFPHFQILRLLPNCAELVHDLCHYDLLGFQTRDDQESFASCAQHVYKNTAPRTGIYPIGVDVREIQLAASRAAQEESVRRMTSSLMSRKLLIGVDRLDYSKGLTERFAAFEHFLETSPQSQNKVTLLQIAPLSRTDVLAYSEIRSALEQSAGRLNGRFAQADWTPIRYLNRNFSHATLMGFLRAADVALVTPIRDGMNLVAKEYLAAQDPENPGVLLLSAMAGAAHELSEALLVNPFDKQGMALALQSALHMPLEERRRRHAIMLERLQRHDIHQWHQSFLRDLESVQT
jgi:trehalose 6-phosphate synthase